MKKLNISIVTIIISTMLISLVSRLPRKIEAKSVGSPTATKNPIRKRIKARQSPIGISPGNAVVFKRKPQNSHDKYANQEIAYRKRGAKIPKRRSKNKLDLPLSVFVKNSR